jgi:LPXTG-site transpeptidase (sortase) family protein
MEGLGRPIPATTWNAKQEQTGREPGTSGRPPRVAKPVVVSMPALNISAELKPLHLDAQGMLVPPEYGLAGWYAGGPRPGEQGPAVIAGHLDTEEGPDVFASLAHAKPGDRIRVSLKDGKTLTFRVTEMKQFPQSDFPTRRVYGPTKESELRLITCGGDYDRAAGHYLDNVVVFADLAS